MTASLPAFNWMPTTVAAGTFNVQSVGWVAGTFIDDPATRNELAGGVLATTETLPMWGGVAINETVTPNGASPAPDGVLGGLITRATSVTAGAAGQITGFSVFNQAYSMTITPQSPVPASASGMLVNFFRLGSNARIVVQCSPALSTLETGSVSQLVSWDFVNQQLTPYLAAYAAEAVTSGTYNSTTGIIALTFGTAPFGAGIGAGADGVYVTITGLAGTGVAPLNGTWAVTGTASSGTVVSLQGPTGLGALTITGSTGNLTAGGGALPCKVLSIEAGNSMTVNYNPTTGNLTWTYTGTVAVIVI